MSKYELIKKISVKTVTGGRPKIPETDKPAWLMEVFGVATGFKTGTTDFGDYVAFTGTFQAINMADGSIYRSGKLFLPDITKDLLLPAVEHPDAKGVEFAFRIGVKADETVATGYVYVAQPLMPVSENDPIELLTNKLKALPAPKEESKPAAVEHHKTAASGKK